MKKKVLFVKNGANVICRVQVIFYIPNVDANIVFSLLADNIFFDWKLVDNIKKNAMVGIVIT